jgi:hypothetical protein
MLGTLTTMGVIVLAAKLGIAIIGSTGVAAGINWFNKKSFKSKGGSDHHDFESDTTRLHR